MATLRITYLKQNRNKNGLFSLYIALSHKGKTCYINTSYTIEDEYQFENGKVICKADAEIINKRLKFILSHYQERIDNIEEISSYSCPQLKEKITTKSPELNSLVFFSDYMKRRIDALKNEGRKTYAEKNEFTLRLFEKSEGKITLKSISVMTINHFIDYLDKKGYSEASKQIFLSHIKATINAGIKEGVVKYELHPFSNFKMPKSEPRQLDITLKDFIKIKNASFTEKRIMLARDLFLLSFYLGGINLIDLVKLNFSNLENDVTYIRSKTENKKKVNKKTIFTIPEQAKPIILKYRGKNGLLDFGYKFSFHNFSCYLNTCLKCLAKRLDINDRLVYYSARKTFAQYAFNLGIRIEVIEYCIGQSVKTNRPIFNYVRVMKSQADIAIKTVIDYTENPEKYEERINTMLIFNGSVR